MGGVSASLAMLGDVNVAEPKALTALRVSRIEQTVREKCLKVSNAVSSLLRKVIDMIVDRRDMRDRLHSLLVKLHYKN